MTQACRSFGRSRTTSSRWAGRAQRSGLAALLPKAGATASVDGPSGRPRWPRVHRSQGTALQEFHRPAFHRQQFARLADLNPQFQGWLQTYNTRRRNHGDLIRDRTPYAVLEAHLS